VDDLEKYRKGLKAYGLGFAIGVLTGFVICVVTSKPLFIMPLVLGLIFGAVGFQIKTKRDERG